MDVQTSPKAMLKIGGSIFFVLLSACLLVEASQIESDLVDQVNAYAKKAKFDWLSVEADGQELVLSGSAPFVGDRREVLEFVENIWGATRVTNNIQLLGESNTCQKEFDRYLSVGRIEFDTGGANISSASQELVNRLSDIARNCDAKIRISGHTDSVGNGEVNLNLSTRRAQNVLQEMLARGVPSEQVKAVGYGETRPIADNSTPEGREQNRRIEIRVTGRT